MGFSRFLSRTWEFLNKPLFFSKDAEEEFVMNTSLYRGLKQERNFLMSEKIKLRRQLNRARKSFEMAKSVARKSQARAKSLERELQDGESLRNLGKHILSDSVTGVLAFDENNMITEANQTLCNYVGIEESELVGSKLGEARTVSHYFDIYSNFIRLVARDNAKKQDSEIKPNRFRINGIIFDIMGYSDDKGGRIVVKPFEERGIVEKLFGRKPIKISPQTKVTKENLAEEIILPLMEYNTSSRYIDFSNSSITRSAMDFLAEFYNTVANDVRGEKERYTLVFQNVSEEERDYLISLGVDNKHIRGKRQKGNSDGILISQPEPAD
ncbi:hypothetical protein DRN73_05005 [Candidatus Pacearchaeota archaeon]|nr:MAG: hypothetical protein DRN73_05005 [Candidatus Pacearchaeota archaeon]